MPKAPSPPTRPLPGWVLWIGSAIVGFHLFAILIHVLAAPSGPWMTRSGPDTAVGPLFTERPNEVLDRYYLEPIKMPSDYHFATNRPEVTAVFFEVHLRNKEGKLINKLTVPDPQANYWVRHRQALLALRLVEGDREVPPPRGEVIADTKQKEPMISGWEPITDERTAEVPRFRLQTVPEHLIKRDRPVYRPSELSIVLARSYLRYLCRKHGAASAELVRHSRLPILAGVVLINPLPPDTLADMIATYEE